MPRVGLIHWHAAEGEERAAKLRRMGYEVESSSLVGAATLRALREDPPAAVVIDLSRVPSHGRDVALAIRQYRATRHVPLIFAEGDPEKVARVTELLPDAVYTTWSRMRGSLRRAIARRLEEPVVPRSRFAGYDGAPLAKKLGIRAGTVVALAGAPRGLERTLGPLPEGSRLHRRGNGRRDLTIWFTRSLDELERRIDLMAARVGAGWLWIVWPKKISARGGGLSQQVVRKVGLEAGLVDSKICAVDETWAGLRFSRRRSHRLTGEH